MTFRHIAITTPIACMLALGLAACGGGGNTPTNPGGGGGGVGTPGPSGATVTIANGRVTPAAVTITAGQSVTFINNDGGVRNVSSDPHPAHSLCSPELNIGNLSNGETKLTGAFTVRRTCTYHNHDDPENAQLKGSIIIQ